MPPTVTPATLAETTYRVALLLGLQDDSVTSFQTIDSSPFTDSDIQKAVRLADWELALHILQSFDHPYRNFFFATPAVTEITTSGDRMPTAIADHSRVEMLPAQDDEEWVNGRLARNVRHVTRAKKHPDVYGAGLDLYFIEHGVIFFNAFKVRITQPQLEITSGANLHCPGLYQDAIVGLAMAKLYQDGGDASQRSFYFEQAERFKTSVLGRLDLPKPERFQQLN